MGEMSALQAVKVSVKKKEICKGTYLSFSFYTKLE
jgi:hypothetical protein